MYSTVSGTDTPFCVWRQKIRFELRQFLFPPHITRTYGTSPCNAYYINSGSFTGWPFCRQFAISLQNLHFNSQATQFTINCNTRTHHRSSQWSEDVLYRAGEDWLLVSWPRTTRPSAVHSLPTWMGRSAQLCMCTLPQRKQLHQVSSICGGHKYIIYYRIQCIELEVYEFKS